MSILENPMKYRSSKFRYDYINSRNTTITNKYDDMNVKKLIHINNLYTNSNFYTWTKGINRINHHKAFVARNGLAYEKSRKTGKPHINNLEAGFLGCSLILYYIESDNDFNTWYKIHTRILRDHAP